MSAGEIIDTQPLSANGVSITGPGVKSTVSSGLENLATVDQLTVKQQKTHDLADFTGPRPTSTYKILNSSDQQAYWAYEESNACHRLCCGSDRGCTFHILDNSKQQEIFTIVRDFKCCAGFCPCFADGCCVYPFYVKDNAGRTFGMARAMTYFCTPRLAVFDADGHLLYEISGTSCPLLTACCKNDITLPVIKAENGSQVGEIRKTWDGDERPVYKDAHSFTVHFPLDLGVKHKALLLAAVFMVKVIHGEEESGD